MFFVCLLEHNNLQNHGNRDPHKLNVFLHYARLERKKNKSLCTITHNITLKIQGDKFYMVHLVNKMYKSEGKNTPSPFANDALMFPFKKFICTKK